LYFHIFIWIICIGIYTEVLIQQTQSISMCKYFTRLLSFVLILLQLSSSSKMCMYCLANYLSIYKKEYWALLVNFSTSSLNLKSSYQRRSWTDDGQEKYEKECPIPCLSIIIITVINFIVIIIVLATPFGYPVTLPTSFLSKAKSRYQVECERRILYVASYRCRGMS
jgi:hypothetical protein